MQYGEKLYGIKKEKEAEDEDDEDDGGDIEASIAKEMDAMAAKKTSKTPKIFTMIPADVECLLFIKTTAPVDPLEFVRAVCNDARSCRDILRRKTRYINRLTPVVAMDKASENGITKVARQVMGPHFNLVAAEEEETDSKAEEKEAITVCFSSLYQSSSRRLVGWQD